MLSDSASFSSSPSSFTSRNTPLFATVSFWTTDPSVVALFSSGSHSSHLLGDSLHFSEDGKPAKGPLAIFRVPIAPQTTVKQLAREGVQRLVYSRRHARAGSHSAAFAASFSHLKVIGAHVSGGSQPPAEVFSRDFVKQVVVLGEERVHFQLHYSSPAFSTSDNYHLKSVDISSRSPSEASSASEEWKASSILSLPSLTTTHQHLHENSSRTVTTSGESGCEDDEACCGRKGFSSHQVAVPPLQGRPKNFREDQVQKSVDCEGFTPTVLTSCMGDKESKQYDPPSTNTKEAPHASVTSSSPDSSSAAIVECHKEALTDLIPLEKENGRNTTSHAKIISSLPSYSHSKPREKGTLPCPDLSCPTAKRFCRDEMVPTTQRASSSTKGRTQGKNEESSGAMNATEGAANAGDDRWRESSSERAKTSSKRSLGWGPRAHEMFPDNYVSSPGKTIRRKPNVTKLQVPHNPSKIGVELKKAVKAFSNSCQEKSPGGFIAVPDIFAGRASEYSAASSDSFCNTQPLVTAPLGMLRELQKATALLSASAATSVACEASEAPGQSTDGVPAPSRRKGWGPEAYKNFASNFVNSPDRYVRELKIRKRQQEEEEKKKNERVSQESTAVRVR